MHFINFNVLKKVALTPVKNEAQLLALVAKGEQRAFTELFDAYYKQLGEYVNNLTESIEVTEEIVQDVFIKIWLKKETLIELDNFSYYLFILCKNQTLNHLRKKANDKVRQSEWLKHIEEEIYTTDNSAVTEEYRVLIDHAINKLPPQQQKIYRLSREERLKHDEIAKLLNISPQTVKKHIKLALRFIKNDVNIKKDAIIIMILSTPLLFL
ncbi:RNA polymerase sigma-70 factor (ECF subfamily) [Mucilaginibacter gracilis]|uniref:RNA polymerase sigma-70 factor (ECF subfamily) n=1 Tax=Mucilaginibacter gracilis TaxID=423350 RepID=A0A495J0H5_9SPHI|nr:RNA polymerase sigma-70 factor [Mucilaginibacter gracilis]RKR81804.1 RNA polymerase sigma-70 factor (ECF subfamily) [Mucilaginibacter gracilis]